MPTGELARAQSCLFRDVHQIKCQLGIELDGSEISSWSRSLGLESKVISAEMVAAIQCLEAPRGRWWLHPLKAQDGLRHIWECEGAHEVVGNLEEPLVQEWR